MGYLPTERDRYAANYPIYTEAWDLMEPIIVPPSLEVFKHGLAEAKSYMKRSVPSIEYAKWLIEWASKVPQDMKEAP